MKNQQKAYLFAILAVLCWSTVATAFKLSLKQMNFAEVLFYSSFFSTVFLFFVILIQGKLVQLKSTPKQFAHSAALGFLNPFIYYLILFKAYSLLPAQEALALNYTWAIVVVIFSILFLKQKVKPGGFFALIVSFAGVIIIATHGDFSSIRFSDTTGVLLAVSSSLVWALYWVLNVKDQRDETVKLFLNFAFGFAFMLVYILIGGNKIRLNPGIWGTLYIGLFEMGLTFILWLKAMKYSYSTALVSNLIFLSPFFSLIFISIILQEFIQTSTILGLVMIVSGIILQQQFSKRDQALQK